MTEATLKRSIGLPLLTLYGLGTILGAGIYVLIGEVAAEAGRAAPSAFVIASLLAGITALSFAELSARLPKSAGEAAYVSAAFKLPPLAIAVGWAVIITGIVSAATMARGFVGYLEVFVDLPDSLVIAVVICSLGILAAWGIIESLLAAAAVTLLEVAGLIFVCALASDSLALLPTQWSTLLPTANAAEWSGILSGAFVAFYAFIGFEDMVNVAEEVKQPRKTLPTAIVITLLISSGLYFLVSTVAVLSLSPAALAATDAPLAAIVESRGVSPRLIAAISLFAVMNGALVQSIMASRVLYGLASQDLAWSGFARIHPLSKTPLIGTAVISAAILIFALFFSLGGLARLTSGIALVIFMLVNASLWRIKTRDGAHEAFTVPVAVPILGLLLCLSMLCYQAVSILRAA